MSIQKYNEKKAAEKKAAEAAKAETVGASVPESKDVTSTAAPVPAAGTPEEVAAQMEANAEGKIIEKTDLTAPDTPTLAEISEAAGAILDGEAEEAELSEWVSPYDVNYKELEAILDGEELSTYVGDRLPEDVVERIEKDYKLYLKNK